MLKVGFIGAGKIAQALAKGFISAGLTKGENIIASSAPQDKPCIEAFQAMGASAYFDNKIVVEKSDVVLVAVKPHIVPTALSEVKSVVTPKHLILSVAMGVTLEDLEKNLPPKTRVVRVMPNTPAMVQKGASVYVPGTSATKEDGLMTKKLMEAVGTCEEAIESYLDPVTALSGSGPAYVYIMIEALADGGVKMGLPRDLAYKLAAQTVVGAGEMVLTTKIHPGQLKDEVTSPAGSTATGLHFLEKNNFRAALIGAIEAATLRCREQSRKNQ
ncbi:Pyrroline-5-carboxylate reductase, putative [Pediculus humanus corporis]|uniref:Pyrroline-5-carboxylate reductase n=1 Tax=Pediculus humanus subsp. corporis TaxID=121224 RepID=E0VU70_PEDHC|nr:Pyrroline-5-carboxylate reductase, putative [Pediculus humanus corporis]EEB16926.1 Pyrroline-5-carboxylate reductase, putative [Pediculus humanus corporis]